MSQFCCGFNHDKILIHKARKRPMWSKTRNPARMEALAKSMSSAISLDLVTGIKTFRNKVNPEKVYNAWVTGGWDNVKHVIPWDKLEKDVEPARGRLQEAMEKFGKIGVDVLSKPQQDALRYDFKNPAIQRQFDKRAGQWIVGIKDDARENIQTILSQQMKIGVSPREMAGQIKNYIGLYPKLAQAHVNYVNGLKKSGMHPDRVDKLGEKYYDKLLNYRAMTIARTETQFTLNRGQLTVWQEGARQGLLPPDSKKVWIVDGNPCPICEPMDGVEVGLDDVWELDDGTTVDIPSESHPNCMCIMTLSMEVKETVEKSGEDDDGSWITINGAHVHIGQDGRPDKGPKGITSQESKQPTIPSKNPSIKYSERLSEKEIDAVKEYQNGIYNSKHGGYSSIQDTLRGTGKYSKEAEKTANNLSSALNKSNVVSNMTVYRGSRGSEHHDQIKVGDKIHDKGFTSTTTDKKIAEKFSKKLNRSDNPTIYEIKLRAGQKALNVKDHSDNKESEIILDKGSTFKVTGVSSRGGVRRITLEKN